MSIGAPRGAETRAWYAATGIPLLTWSSLAGGFLSGRVRRDNPDSFDTYLDRLAVTSYVSEDNLQRLERAMAMAEAKGVSLPQLPLVYMLRQTLSVVALVGANTGDEFAANAAALDIELTPDEMRWLERGDENAELTP